MIRTRLNIIDSFIINKKIGKLHAVTNNGSTSKAILPAAISISDLISSVNTIDYPDNAKKHIINIEDVAPSRVRELK